MGRLHLRDKLSYVSLHHLHMRILNKSYSCSQYWTGTTLQWSLMRRNIIKKKRKMSFEFQKTSQLASVAS